MTSLLAEPAVRVGTLVFHSPLGAQKAKPQVRAYFGPPGLLSGMAS